MACQINNLGFCTGCPDKCPYGDVCRFLQKGYCWNVHSSQPHGSCRFQDQNKDNLEEEETNFDQALADKLTICTLNIKMGSNREELKAFLQEMNCKDIIVCLQELLDDRDLMDLLDHLKETKFMFSYCGRSSHSHCAVLSTLPLKEVKDNCMNTGV